MANLTNLKMVCSYRYDFIYLPVALVGCLVGGCPSFLHRVCQGEYLVLNYIYLDGGEKNICCDCDDKLWGGGKS